MHHPKLHLTLSNLKRLFRATGVTDALLLSLSRDKQDLNLSATLYGASGNQPIATPLVIVGSSDAINNSLPVLAKALATELGVTDLNDIPITTGLTANEMKFIGSISLSYKPWFPPNADMNAKLASLAKTSPLAAAMALGNSAHPLPKVIMDLPQQLSSLTPMNTAALGILINMGSREILRLQPVLSHNFQLWPHNYILAIGSAKLHKIIHGTQSEDSANFDQFQNATLTDPKNPQAWVALYNESLDNGEDIRHSRISSDLSSAVWNQLNTIYSKAVTEAEQAISLDSLDPQALTALATAECLNGNITRAKRVLQKEQHLYPKSKESYLWGLQMYQSKWMSEGNALLLDDCKKYATASDYDPDAWQAVTALKDDNHPQESDSLANTIINVNRNHIKKDPSNLKYKSILAVELIDSGKISEANSIFTQLMNSSDYGYLASYAEGMDDYYVNKFAACIPYFQKALEICPDDHSIYNLLGYALKATGLPNQGIALIKMRLKEDPYDWYAEENLGDYYAVRSNYSKAVPLLQDSVDRNPFQTGYGNLVQGYVALNDNSKAMSTAQAGLQYNTRDSRLYFLLGDGYYQEHDYRDAEKYYEVSLSINNTFALAYNNAGDAYRHTGDIHKARAYWNKCLTLTHDPSIIADAQTHLNKYH